jgi:cytochrome bd-type quinol oxidase subunit 1
VSESTELTSVKKAFGFFFDALCVITFVVIGTRNHDTDTGVSGVLYVAAPFWIAMVLGWFVSHARRNPFAVSVGTQTWIVTLVIGMMLRNLVFDRGTATSFMIVAAIFLAVTMLGWRAIFSRSRPRVSASSEQS